MIETADTAVHITEQQLRKALVTLLGSSAQVTARDFSKVFPKKHWAIAWDAWKAAAEAEGLEIEGEKPWGITIWRKGAAKQPVPAMTQPTATKTTAQQSAPCAPDDAQKIAAAARSYMDAERKAGREVSATDAVHAVIKQRSAGSR